MKIFFFCVVNYFCFVFFFWCWYFFFFFFLFCFLCVVVCLFVCLCFGICRLWFMVRCRRNVQKKWLLRIDLFLVQGTKMLWENGNFIFFLISFFGCKNRIYFSDFFLSFFLSVVFLYRVRLRCKIVWVMLKGMVCRKDQEYHCNMYV